MSSSTSISEQFLTVAREEFYQELVKRLPSELQKQFETRLDPKVVNDYCLRQFSAWQERKVENNEVHEHISKKFSELPPAVQQSIARLSEFRLVVLQVLFPSETLKKLVEYGESLTPNDKTNLEAELSAVIAASKSEAKTLTTLASKKLENHFSDFDNDGVTVSATVEQLHHAVWLINLSNTHDFAYPIADLPVDTNKAKSGKEYPDTLRIHSAKADIINLTGWIKELAATVKQFGFEAVFPLAQPQIVDLSDTRQKFTHAGAHQTLATIEKSCAFLA